MDYDKYIKTSEGKRVRERSRKNLRHTLYFDIKEREKLKKDMLKLQKFALAIVENQKQPEQYSDLKDNSLGPAFLDLSTSFLEGIREGEEFTKSRELYKCTFSLLRHESKRSVVFTSRYKRGTEAKWRKAYLLIAAGLPTKGVRRRFKLIRGRFNLSGYRKVDSGTFEQELLDEYVFTMKYVGEDNNYKFKLTNFRSRKDQGYLETIT